MNVLNVQLKSRASHIWVTPALGEEINVSQHNSERIPCVACLFGYLFACLFYSDEGSAPLAWILRYWRQNLLRSLFEWEIKCFRKKALGTTQWFLMCCLPSSVHLWNSEKLIRFFFSSKELTQHYFYMKIPRTMKVLFVEVGECSA